MADGQIRVKTSLNNSEWEKLQKEIEKTENKLGALKKRQEKYDATGVKKTGQSYKNLEYDIKSVNQTLDELYADEKRFSQSLKNVSDPTPWQNMKSLMRKTVSDMPRLFKKSIAGGVKSAAKAGEKSVRGLANLVKNSAVSSFKKLGSVATNAFKKISSHTKKTSGLMSNFSSRLRGIALSLLVFNWISKGFNAMVAGMKQGFQNLARYSDDFNASMSDLKSETSQLKNSLAAAFAPIVQTAIPYLTQLVNMLNQAADSMGRFFAMISGKSTYTRAKKQTEDYAKSLESTGKTAEETKNSLASFDKLNVIGNKSDSGKSGTSGTDPSDMFEEAEVGPKTDFAQGMKDAIDSGDWEGCGKLLAEKVNGMMRSVDFSGAQEKAKSVVSQFTGGLNGFIRNFDWGSFGNLIGEGLNTALYVVQTFLTTLDWGALGAGLASGINGVISSFDAAALGDTLGAKFMAAVDFLHGFVTTLDWEGIGTSIYTCINHTVSSIDFAKIGVTLSKGAKGFLKTMTTAVKGTDWSKLGESIGTAIRNIDWKGIFDGLYDFIVSVLKGAWSLLTGVFKGLGVDSIQGFFLGMWSILKGIGKWIKEKMIDPLVNAVKKLLGIHSPSTVFAELGRFLVDGFLLGTKNAWSKITSFFKNSLKNLKNFISDSLKSISTVWGDLWRGMGDTFENIVNVIPATIEKVINAAIGIINELIVGVNKLVGKIPMLDISIPTIPNVSIPRLATGAVIPPNSEFLAILGDQKHGTNIEAPLDTIVAANIKALREVMSEMRGTGKTEVTFRVEGDPHGIFKIVRQEANDHMNRTGMAPFPI